MAKFSDIQNAIDAVVRANGGRAYIGTQSAERQQVRDRLEILANACGVQAPREEGLSNTQLTILYATARKDMAKAVRIAAKMNEDRKPEPNPLLDEFGWRAPKPEPEPEPEPAPPHVDLEAILEAARKEASAMADYVAKDRLEAFTGTLAETVAHLVREQSPTTVVIEKPDAAPVEVGTCHYMFPSLMRALGLGDHVYLYGPAGSGKTTAAKQAAKALELPFHFTGKVDSEYLLLGFSMPNGDVHRTPFREAFENGGLFLFDEIDRSDASAITAINAALANGYCAFPDGVVYMNENFKCIAGGNTTMTGADSQYSAGVQQDASAIDRFAFIEWPYDETLERALAPNADWCEFVQNVRKVINERGLDHLVTPRATIRGGHWINAGEDWSTTAKAQLWKGLDADTVAQVIEALPSNLTEKVAA